MTTVIVYHEVADGDRWAKAWRKGSGSRHEYFAKYGVTVRNFRDPENTQFTGVLMEVADMKRFKASLESEEGKKAIAEDGLKVETMRMLVEFTP